MEVKGYVAFLLVAVVASMPLKETTLMLDESYTDAETEHAVPELDASLTKSMEAAALTNKAHDALKAAESASAVANSITEAVTVAKAKVKSAAALVAVAQKNYDESAQHLQESQDAEAASALKKHTLQKDWTSAKQHESSTVVISAKAMKESSASGEELTKLRAKAILAEREYAHLLKEDRLAKHAYQIAATKSADAARKAAELGEEAHEALENIESDSEATGDGRQEAAATKSALATKSGEQAAKLAHDAASVGQFATDAAKKVADAHDAMAEAKKMLGAATGKADADGKKVKATITVAVDAKKNFEEVDEELNGKEGEVGDSHVKAMALAESQATAEAALDALNKAKVELKTATEKFSQLDARGREAQADAEARKAAARAASKAASIASQAAAELAAKVADTVSETIDEALTAAPADEGDKSQAASSLKKRSEEVTHEVTLGDDDDEIESLAREKDYAAHESGFGLDS